MATAFQIVGMPNAVSGLAIKGNVQRGVISITAGNTTATATISTVNPNKTEFRFLGAASAAATSISDGLAGAVLTNSTTVTASRFGTGGSSAVNVYWELTEFY